jgi:hypothetical protein
MLKKKYSIVSGSGYFPNKCLLLLLPLSLLYF